MNVESEASTNTNLSLERVEINFPKLHSLARSDTTNPVQVPQSFGKTTTPTFI